MDFEVILCSYPFYNRQKYKAVQFTVITRNISESCSPIIENLPCIQTISAAVLAVLMSTVKTMVHTGNWGVGNEWNKRNYLISFVLVK